MVRRMTGPNQKLEALLIRFSSSTSGKMPTFIICNRFRLCAAVHGLHIPLSLFRCSENMFSSRSILHRVQVFTSVSPSLNLVIGHRLRLLPIPRCSASLLPGALIGIGCS